MGFSDKQVRQLRARLKPRHVRTRTEDGNILHYVEGWHVIAEANRIFGFDGWDREMVESSCVYTKHLGVRFEAVYVARIRITVKTDGGVITREGSGTGEASTSSPGKAHELALKAAETDATKRALMTFGNAFGLSLYDPNNPLREKAAPPVFDHAGSGGEAGAKEAVHDEPNGHHHHDEPLRELPATTIAIGTMGRSVPPNGLKGHAHPNRANGKELECMSGPSSAGSGAPRRELSPSHKNTADDTGAVTGEGGESPAPDTPVQTATNDDASQHSSASNEVPCGQTALQARIDKSELTLAEPKRRRDPEHLKYVVKHGCIVCGRNRTHAHHLTFAQPHALGRKVSDEYTVPLCARHHQELHHAGDEESWWRNHSVDPLAVADELWERSRRSRAGA